jgi:DNA-binding XRE family transcriptional regulator
MYEELGKLLEGAHARRALSQGALAAQIEVTQQTVSRWEKGQSRPRGKTVIELAAALGLAVGDIEDAAGSKAAVSMDDAVLPVRPLLPVLPLNTLSADIFERFVADLVSRRLPDASVAQLGGQGDDQRGYDILVVHPDGRRTGIQCKREQQFGRMKVRKAVSAGELQVDDAIIALARPATADARFEMDSHSGWQLWDQADMSRQIRTLPDEIALQLVRTYFPNHVEHFLGVPAAGPWMTVDEFYRSTSFTLLNHRQPLIGREDTIVEIAQWALDPDASEIALLLGRGGLGKSKILREVASRTYDDGLHFRFLAVDQTPAPADFDSLPRSGSLVVVIDDAHRVDNIAGIAAQLWQHRPNAKLLLATRPYGATVLESEVWKLGQTPHRLKRFSLDDLSHADACQLVASLIDRSIIDPLTRQLATISADCPFVAIVAADLLERHELSASAFASEAALRAEVLRRFSELTTSHGSTSDAVERRAILAAVAAFQPVRLSDEDFAKAITTITRIDSWDEVNGRIRELEDDGLVMRRGDAVRVVPDMLGDIVLGQAAYDDRADRATSYLPRAQAAASGVPLQHLLVNASRMDWQVRDGAATQIDMVGQLWKTLEEELLSGSFDQQVALLKLVAKIAYYQPQPALELIESMLALVIDPAETPAADSSIWAASRDDVLHGLSPVLRNVAYRLEYLPRALELLWVLAQDDRRPTNQYPDHPVRVLQQLADLQTGKPFQYIHAIIDAATGWLGEPSKISPFDVIGRVLAVEGSEELSSDLTLTFYSFQIDPASVRELRKRVLDLAVEQARGKDIIAAVRGIKALEGAIRGPGGRFGREPSPEERAVWAREFVPIIETLGQIG